MNTTRLYPYYIVPRAIMPNPFQSSAEVSDSCDSSISNEGDSPLTCRPPNHEKKSEKDYVCATSAASLPQLPVPNALQKSKMFDNEEGSLKTVKTVSTTSSTTILRIPDCQVTRNDAGLIEAIPKEITCSRKSVRFECIGSTTVIRRRVRFMDSDHANPDLWWSDSELREIRRRCTIMVSEYRLRGEGLILAYLRLQKKTLSPSEFRCCRERLAASYGTRGLERHISNAASDLQHHQYVHAVLNAQKVHENAMEEIGNAARKASLASRQRAQRMAICDYHLAMNVYLER